MIKINKLINWVVEVQILEYLLKIHIEPNLIDQIKKHSKYQLYLIFKFKKT